MIYKLGNARKRMATDIGRVKSVKDKYATLLTGDDEVKDIWLGHFDDLLNIENERDNLEGILPVQGPLEEIYLEKGITQLVKVKRNKARGPDCLPIEVAKALGDEGNLQQYFASTVSSIYMLPSIVCNY